MGAGRELREGLLRVTCLARYEDWAGLAEADYRGEKLRWFGLIPVPPIGAIANLPPDEKERWHDILFSAHQTAGYLLYALVALHIAAALKHQFLDKEPEMQRMGVG